MWPPFLCRLLTVLGEETGSGAGEVVGALVGEEAAVNLDVVPQHLKAVAEFVGSDLAVFHIDFFHERDAVRHHPSVALAGNCAKLVVNGEALFVGGNDGCE